MVSPPARFVSMITRNGLHAFAATSSGAAPVDKTGSILYNGPATQEYAVFVRNVAASFIHVSRSYIAMSWFKDAKSKLSIFGELWAFMKVRKKWWLGPIMIFLLLLGVLIVFTEGSALAPFIYALF
jgi:hypothetical protein